jgi:HSP90 family molecular chaperone
VLKEIKSGKVKPIKNKKLEEAVKGIVKAVKKVAPKKVKKVKAKKEPKAKAVKTFASTTLTMVQIKKVLDTVGITANATVIKVEKILITEEPKHAKCYRLMLLGIKNKTISELTGTPAPAVGRNIWFYTSGKYELS